MTLMMPKGIEIDSVADSAYWYCTVEKPISHSREVVVGPVENIKLSEGSGPESVAFTFGLRDFVEGMENVLVIILDISPDGALHGVQIPHFSDAAGELLQPR